MSVDLTAGIVRILKPAGTTAGTGFVVSDEGLIATCSHVVQYAEAGPGGTVRVAFHATGEERKAQVEPDWWRAPDAEDVAILRLDGPLQEGVTSLPLGSSAGVEGHALTTFGFPDAKPVEGMAGKCEVVGRTTEKGFPVLQLRSTEVTPGFSGAPVLDTATRRVVGMVTAITVPDPYGRLPETAFITPTETLRAVCPVLQLSDLCPYQGLAAFTADHAEFFFGREKLVADLVDHLRGNPRFLAVVGPSGSGKSSVVQAGLFPALRRGEVPGSADWHLLSFRHGADPFAALTTAGLDVSQKGDLPAAIRAFLEAHPQVKRLVLFADQFEELFTLCPQPVQEQFLRQLAALLESNLAVTVVLTLRADFYGHLLRYRPLVDWLKIGQVNVPPMGPEELRAAVEEPATRLGLRFEPGLVETIVEEAGEVGHPLPLLESALTQLWEKREDGTLTHTAYQAAGRVAGAIGQWAEDAYTELAPEERPLARRVFTRLVRYGEGEVADTRQRQPLSELVTRPEERELLHRLVQRLANARLLVTGGDPGAEMVEIIHDALLQQWSRLKHWTAEQREFYLWRQRLDERLQEWEEKKYDDGALLLGALLAEAERWLAERPEELNQKEKAYVQKSTDLRIREDAARERSRKRRIRAMIVLSAIFLAMAVVAGVGWSRANKSRQQIEAQSRVVLAQSLAAMAPRLLDFTNDYELATLVTLESHYLNRHAGGNAHALIDSSLRAILGDSDYNTILRGHDLPILSLTFSPDGKTLASISPDNTVLLWDLNAPGTPPRVLSEPDASVAYGFSPGGEILTFSPDARILASGGRFTSTIRVWDLSNLEAEPHVLIGHKHGVSSIAISPDSKTLACGGSDNTVRLWNLSNLEADPHVLSGVTSRVLAVAFSPDGKTLASGNRDGTVWLWDLFKPNAPPQVLYGHEDRVHSVAFSPDGKTLASGSQDNTVRLWDLSNLKVGPRVLSENAYAVSSVIFSPDSKTLACGGSDNTVRLWDLSNLEVGPSVFSDHAVSVHSVAFSPDGKTLASGSSDGTIRLRNLRRRRALPYVLKGHHTGVYYLAFSPNGKTLASGSGDGTIFLWDLRRLGELPRRLQRDGSGLLFPFVAFSPDGWTLASASSYSSTVRLWDLLSLEVQPRVLIGHDDIVHSVAFSPDGKTLASGSSDNTIRLWDLRNLEAQPRVLSGHDGAVHSVAFSPNGEILASGSWDRTIRLWTTETDKLITLACEEVRRNLTQAEWNLYLPGEPYRPTCPNLPVPEE